MIILSRETILLTYLKDRGSSLSLLFDCFPAGVSIRLFSSHQGSGTFSRVEDKPLYGYGGRCYNKFKWRILGIFELVGFMDIAKVEESRFMDMILKKEYEGLRLFLSVFCVLIIILFQWAATGNAEGEFQALNSSGNRNLKPAVDPIGRSEGYSAVLYNNRNGMPTSEANAIAQTQDGFIWIGSYAGLIRYDGNAFERFGSDDGIANVRCLYVDSKDRLWIGTNDSGFFLLSNGKYHHWDKSDGLVSVSIRSIAEAENGMIYIAGTAGVGVVDESLQYTHIEDERLSGQTISEVRLGCDGLVYGVSNTGDLFTLEEGKLVFWQKGSAFPFEGILSVLPDPEHPGFLYIGTEQQICYGNLEQGFDTWKTWDISPLLTVQSMEFIDGRIWICSRTGLGMLEDDGVHLIWDIPMNNSFVHIMTDRDGNLWVVSGRQGVMKIVPNRFSDLFEQFGLPADVVNSTCILNEQLFVGTENGLTVIEDGQVVSGLPLTRAVKANGELIDANDLLEYLEGIRIRSIIRDSRNRLWISTARERGLLRYDHGEVTQFTKEDGLLSEAVRVVSECEDGSVLVATNDGFNVIEGDRVVKQYGSEEISVRLILSIIEGFNHELIACSDGGGIYIIDSAGMKQIGLEDGLSSEVVLRIRRSHTQDLYWIITGKSLECMTPDYQVKTIREFPYENNYDLYENSRGDLWILGSTGIYVIFADELTEGETAEPVFFGIPNGLPYFATANSYSEQTQAGDLYISGNEGIIKVNINNPFENTGEMRISVPYIDADGLRYYPDDSGSFVLPGNTQKLTVYPYVLNYSLIDPEVAYHLEGFDLRDTTVSRSKLISVDYTNLKLGTYQFVVTVKDPVGHTEQTGSFRIIKGREMSAGAAGTIIMDSASLFLLGGILVCTSLYRRRGRLEDRLFFAIALSNIALAAGELLSYILEYSMLPFIRDLMIFGNTVFYISLVLFPYLLLLYLEYSINPDTVRMRKRKLLLGIPCFLFIMTMIINLKTGWIFSIREGNVYHAGLYRWMNYLPVIPVWFYFLLSLFRMIKLNIRLAIVILLLLLTRLSWELWYQWISSTAFMYTLLLVCTHINVMNKPVTEGGL